MKLDGPDTRYMMMWKGAWRPVTNMFDQRKVETNIAATAVIAVLFVKPDYWVTTVVNSADLIERVDRDPKVRVWDYID